MHHEHELFFMIFILKKTTLSFRSILSVLNLLKDAINRSIFCRGEIEMDVRARIIIFSFVIIIITVTCIIVGIR